MAKLYFRYGSVGSAKTMNLLAVAHSYRQQGKSVSIIKPASDKTYATKTKGSPLEIRASEDLLVQPDTVLPVEKFLGVQCILVDEAQFLSPFVVEQLREIVCELSIPVICYGLRGDFRNHLFDGSRRLMELADAIDEVKSTCSRCTSKAVFNLKFIKGRPTNSCLSKSPPDEYQPVCAKCYAEAVAAPWEAATPELVQ